MNDTDAVDLKVPMPAGINELRDSAPKMVQLANAFVCSTQDDYTLAAGELQRIKSRREALDAARKSITRPIDEAKERVMGLFKPVIALLDEAERIYKRTMLAYVDEQERKRREEQARLDEIARKEREALEAKARKAAEKGKDERADALAQQAASTVAAVSGVAKPAAKGISTKTTWKCSEEIDVVALCRAIADGKVATIAVEPNMKFLNQQARSLEELFNIPGCKAVPERTIAASKRV